LNEDAEESKADEYDQTDEQPTTTHREVILQTVHNITTITNNYHSLINNQLIMISRSVECHICEASAMLDHKAMTDLFKQSDLEMCTGVGNPMGVWELELHR